MSISRLTGSPTFSVPRVVASQVWGMMFRPKRRALDRVDRQRHAIDRDRALGGDDSDAAARGPRSSIRCDPPSGVDRDDAAQTIDMARDDMAAQLVAELRRPLQIDRVPRGPAAQRRLVQRLARHLDREPAVEPFSTTVRQQPAWLIEAPRSMPDTSQAVSIS